VLTRLFGPRMSGAGTRAFDMLTLLDTVMICAIATILLIRTQLWLTNYPQLGGHGLHIAHLLWGGLGMLIAIFLLVSYLSPVIRRVGAILGGIGLGFFIDELGKFLTSDNNYFFKPTGAIIYIFFVVFYLVARALHIRRIPSPREYLVNAIELAKDAALDDLDADEKRRALRFLDRADQNDPAVGPLRTLFENAHVLPRSKAPPVQRLMNAVHDRYARLVTKRWFVVIVTAIFVFWSFVVLIEIVSLIFAFEPHLRSQQTVKIVSSITSKSGDYGFVEWANIVSTLIAGMFVLWGLVRLRRSRLAAYAMWDRALLVELFFVQVFVFLQTQFAACIGFVVTLVLLITLRFMERSERELLREREKGEKAEPALARPVPA
jgi:hypothetical protein